MHEYSRAKVLLCLTEVWLWLMCKIGGGNKKTQKFCLLFVVVRRANGLLAGRTFAPGRSAGRNVQARESSFGQRSISVRRANENTRRANNTGTWKFVLRITFEPWLRFGRRSKCWKGIPMLYPMKSENNDFDVWMNYWWWLNGYVYYSYITLEWKYRSKYYSNRWKAREMTLCYENENNDSHYPINESERKWINGKVGKTLIWLEWLCLYNWRIIGASLTSNYLTMRVDIIWNICVLWESWDKGVRAYWPHNSWLKAKGPSDGHMRSR